LTELPATAATRRTGLDPRIERSRKAVLKATIELISEEGFAACTMDVLVKRTGVAKATIYRHWANRDALIKSAIDELTALADAPDTGTLRGDLIEFFAARVREMGENPFSRQLQTMPAIFEAARRDPAFAELMAKFVEGLIGGLSAVLARARDRGEINAEGDLRAMANLILGGLMIRQALNNQPSTDATLPAEVDLIIAAFRSPDRARLKRVKV